MVFGDRTFRRQGISFKEQVVGRTVLGKVFISSHFSKYNYGRRALSMKSSVDEMSVDEFYFDYILPINNIIIN
jgi:hypothetical protein